MVAAATAAATLEGRWPLADFERLGDSAPAGKARSGELYWSVRGQRRSVPGGEDEIWLHLVARARVWRECQRCLQPVALDLEVARPLRFVATEEQAAALDAENEDDVLALGRRLDLHHLIEDELLLALPLVPMHSACPQAPPMRFGEDEAAADAAPAPRPFAALARLKRGRGP